MAGFPLIIVLASLAAALHGQTEATITPGYGDNRSSTRITQRQHTTMSLEALDASASAQDDIMHANGTDTLERADISATEEPTSMVPSAGKESDLADREWSWIPISWTWIEILALTSAVLGIVGNLLVMIVLYQRRAASRTTDTLVGALALADFITSIFVIPLPIASRVPDTPLGDFYCKLGYPKFFLFPCVTVSIYTLMSISVERYIAVAYPMYFKRILTRRRILLIIALIWVGTFAFHATYFLLIFIVDSDLHICRLHFATRTRQHALGVVLVSYRLIIPTLVMLVTQLIIAVTLQRQSKQFQDKRVITIHETARNRVLKLMLTVIIIYIVCWSPSQISFLLFNLGIIHSFIDTPIDSGFIVLSFYNSCVNPIIYTARFPEFRAALKDIFRCSSTAESFTSLFEEKKQDTSATVVPSERVRPGTKEV